MNRNRSLSECVTAADMKLVWSRFVRLNLNKLSIKPFGIEWMTLRRIMKNENEKKWMKNFFSLKNTIKTMWRCLLFAIGSMRNGVCMECTEKERKILIWFQLNANLVKWSPFGSSFCTIFSHFHFKISQKGYFW